MIALADALQRLIAQWRKEAVVLDDGTNGCSVCSTAAWRLRWCADELEAALRSVLGVAPAARQPDFWRCNTCGCLWRDNHDDISVSLASANQKSCRECEMKGVYETCEPLYREAATRQEEPSDQLEQARRIENITGKAIGSEIRRTVEHLEAEGQLVAFPVPLKDEPKERYQFICVLSETHCEICAPHEKRLERHRCHEHSKDLDPRPQEQP